MLVSSVAVANSCCLWNANFCSSVIPIWANLSLNVLIFARLSSTSEIVSLKSPLNDISLPYALAPASVDVSILFIKSIKASLVCGNE